MAEDQGGQRKDLLHTLPWLKLFSGFKVALDPKKLLLAGAGILVMSVGWWLLSMVFSAFWSGAPQWKDYSDQADKEQAWKEFKRDRRRYNLFYEMAGRPPETPAEIQRQDAGDLANSFQEFLELQRLQRTIQGRDVEVRMVKEVPVLRVGADEFPITVDKDVPPPGRVPPAEVRIVDAKEKRDDKMLARGTVTIRGVAVTMAADDIAKLEAALLDSKSPEQLRQENLNNPAKLTLVEKAAIMARGRAPIKPFGRLRTLPWSEYRGPNPYLLITGNVAGPDGTRAHPWRQGGFIDWIVTEQAPVLLEPLVKFLRPVIYLFHSGSGGWNLIYLVLVILWGLVTWAVFGGAITRMAAVQVARHNEKVGMMDAVKFARSRFQSFFSAPLFPLIFLAIMTVLLIIYGLVEGFTWFIGDILVAGLLWPLVLLAGLVMAVVLVGLVGWPLMYSTISAEGSDSFDALSRSYSYVYQAPWHYLWYSAVAVVYGAVLVFFVGFMGSLLAYLGKWGVTEAPYLQSREPSYLFAYAPTSFGWRDLLLHNSPEATTQAVIRPTGTVVQSYVLRPSYLDSLSWNNRIGAFLVSIWLGLLFLLIVGFGYSYFWTAATIIYLLMRRKVDDTEMDEIHLEEEAEEPFPTEPVAAGTPSTAEAIKPVMVEAPTLRTSTAPPIEVAANSPSTAANPATPPVAPAASPSPPPESVTPPTDGPAAGPA